MKRSLGLAVAVPVAVAIAVAPSVAWSGGGDHGGDGRGDGRTVLEWDVMAGVDTPFTGAANAIRGIPGGGLPWVLDRGRGELTASGRLRIRVDGLVLARRAPVPPERQGINPAPAFVAAVNCLTAAEPQSGETVRTAPVAVGPDGDARIRAKLDLPKPCYAPVVFVGTPPSETNATGSWFAVTGH